MRKFPSGGEEHRWKDLWLDSTSSFGSAGSRSYHGNLTIKDKKRSRSVSGSPSTPPYEQKELVAKKERFRIVTCPKE